MARRSSRFFGLSRGNIPPNYPLRVPYTLPPPPARPTTRSEPLAAGERALIRKHLAFYRSLDSGQRVPDTDAQRQFVDVCRGKRHPTTPHEIAYMKWRALQRVRR